MPLEIVRNDITKMPVDAIVNATNIVLKMGMLKSIQEKNYEQKR